MKATVDDTLCSDCGVCSDTLPEVFGTNDDGKTVVLVDPIPEEHEDATRDTADSCPMGAIVLE
ncbi:MAG: ferredoxin [Planctomycetota bacterium]|nr:ferredoxin [Planctomycetota bacterium]